MLIEPTPALPPSRSGRARLLATIALPGALLVGVVGIGALTRDVEAGPVAAFIPLDQLASLDAVAAGAARDALGTAGVTLDEVKGVWYVRVMVRDDNPVDTRAGEAVPRRLGWVNLTADGALLGAAIDGISYDAPSR